MWGVATAGGCKQSTGRVGLVSRRQEIVGRNTNLSAFPGQRPATPGSPPHRHGFVIPVSRASAAMRGL